MISALARRAPFAEIEGEVNFAGRVMTSRDLTYIPQFDAINPTLTVFEHLRLVGELTSANEEEMFARAEKLLEVLGLLEKRDVQVKDLSGGEVKRVSVGVGMISNPHVLFLDGKSTKQKRIVFPADSLGCINPIHTNHIFLYSFLIRRAHHWFRLHRCLQYRELFGFSGEINQCGHNYDHSPALSSCF